MTIEILKKGTDTYYATCEKCGCEFTYQREDVHTHYSRVGDYVACPTCGHAHLHLGVKEKW